MKIITFELFENANQTLGNTAGMGKISAPQPVQPSNEVEIPEETRIPEPPTEEEETQNESVVNFQKFNEDGGVANATLGNTAGMGNVVAPTVASTPGDVAGSTKGSGDIVATNKKKKIQTKPKKKPTKESRHLGTDSTKEDMYVTTFTDWLNPDATE